MDDEEISIAPSLAIAPDGTSIITWQGHADSSDQYFVYAQKLSTSGQRLWSSDIRVNPDTGRRVFTPDVQVDQQGNAALSWWDDRHGSGDIYAQWLDPAGQRLWNSDVRVNADSGTAAQEAPALAADSTGNVLLAWTDNRNGNTDVYAQRIDANGNRLWSADVRVNSDTGTGEQHSPAIIMGSDGSAVLAWVGMGNDGNADIYAQKLDVNGNRQWPNDVRVNINVGTVIVYGGQLPRYLGRPAIVADNSGHTVVVWQDNRRSTTDNRIGEVYAQKLDANGQRVWQTDVRVDGSDQADVGRVDTAMDANGNTIIVWHDGNTSDIHAQKLDSNGTRLWPTDVTVNQDTEDNQRRPAVAVDTDGNAFVIWEDFRDIQGVYIQGVYSQKLDPNGSRLWAADIPISTADAIKEPSLTIDSNNQALAVWVEESDGNTDHIYAQKIDGNGGKLWSTDVRVNAQQSSIPPWFVPTAIATSPDGSAFVAWLDWRNGNDDVYVQKLNAVGTRGWPADLQVVNPDQFYLPEGVVQSRAVDTLDGSITTANLTADYQENGGTVQFSLSNDGGATWADVTPGTNHVFSSSGSDLHWKAVLTPDPLWPRAPTITGVTIDYSSRDQSADDYEPDDTCAQAQPIAVNGAAQHHTFAQQGDADWVRFEVTQGATYIIQTANAQPNADTILSLYQECTQPLGSDDNAFGSTARLTWQATFSGPVYAQVTNHDPAVSGSGTGYDLSVRTVVQAPVAIIVAGRDDRDSLQANIHYSADRAYRAFLSAGVPKDNLHYLSHDLDRDVDGNGQQDDVAGAATPENVRDAIQSWARTRGVGLGVPFFVYLIDHGHHDQFLANGTQGKIYATDLDLWLSNLEATSGADMISVIIEACRSGSFIDITAQGPAEISGRNRVVIASTSSQLNAFPSLQGSYFSDTFWTAMEQSQDMHTAFEWATDAVQATGLSQEPWLDDNGDSVADGKDGALARNRGLGLSFGSSPPFIDWITIGAVSNGEAQIQAQVRDDFAVQNAHIEIYPPDFVEPAPTTDGTTPVLNVPTRTLTVAASDVYQVNYSDFTQDGMYRVVVYAEDDDGQQALPQSATVCLGCTQVYLPLVQRYREHCRVMEPPQLVTMVRESIDRMAQRYTEEPPVLHEDCTVSTDERTR